MELYCRGCGKQMHLDLVDEDKLSACYRYYCECGLVLYRRFYDGVLTSEGWVVPVGYDLDGERKS